MHPAARRRARSPRSEPLPDHAFVLPHPAAAHVIPPGVAGVPVALLGLLGYAGILVSLLVRTEHGVLATAFLAFVGFGYSLYLTSVEAFRLEAWCQWCVVSAILMTAIAVLAALRVLHAARADVAPRRPVHG